MPARHASRVLLVAGRAREAVAPGLARLRLEGRDAFLSADIDWREGD